MAEDPKRQIIKNERVIRRILDDRVLLNVFLKEGDRYLSREEYVEVVSDDQFRFQNTFPGGIDWDSLKDHLFHFKMFGQNGAIEFKSPFIGLKWVEELPYLNFSFPKELSRIQRRETFRVTVNIPCRLFLDDKEREAVILDISLGGALIASNFRMDPSFKGRIEFHLPEEEELFEMTITAKRLVKIESLKSRYAYHVGLKFQELNGRMEQCLSSFIIAQQLKDKRAGR